MVQGAPRLEAVLPALLEFLRGAVLVAHNAPFDTGFLRAACERHGHAWPRPPVLCSARLARAVLPREEVPSVRLGALARHFGTATTPTHRADADARATVEVLHHLLERIGNLGVQSLEELLALAKDSAPHRPTTAQRRKRELARSVPSAPGVYLFRGRATRSSTSARAATCTGASAATSPPASGGAGCGTWSRWPSASTPWCARTRWRRRCASCA
jgi:DNA polymerase-3 subunit epsilon